MSKKLVSDLIKDSLRLIVDNYTRMLLDGLVEDEILTKTEGAIVSYRLNYGVRSINALGRKEYANLQLADDFVLLKQAVRGVIDSVVVNDSCPDVSLGERVSNLFEIAQIRVDPRISKLLAQDMDEPYLSIDTVRMLREGGFNLKSLTLAVLGYYASEKIKTVYGGVEVDEYGYESDETFLLVTKHNEGMSGSLLLKIVFRRKELDTIKEDIIKVAEYFSDFLKSERLGTGRLILIMFTDAITASFRRLLAGFERNIRELFLHYKSRIFFIPVSMSHLGLIEDEFKRVKNEMWFHSHGTIELRYVPEVILRNRDVTTNARFLSATQGSLACWVRPKPFMEYYESLMNFQYVFAHATNDFKDIKGTYENVFAVGLAPDKTNISGDTPSRVWWRAWISNEKRENHYLHGPVLGDKVKWYHLLVRWDHSIPKMEFLIDGTIVASSSTYPDFWPKQILQEAFLGCWGNRADVHYINVPLFRAVSSDVFLDDGWVRMELESNNPDRLGEAVS